MALEVALMALEGTATELWFDQLEGLRQLADSHLSTRDRDLFRALQEHVCVRGGADDQQALDTRMLTQVLLALGHPDGPRELELTYKAASTGRTSARTVVPFTLTHDVFSGGTFLLAWDPAKQQPRHFRLARIEEARALARRGLIPDKRPLEQARELQIGGWFSPDPPFRVSVRVGGTNWPQALLDAPPRASPSARRRAAPCCWASRPRNCPVQRGSSCSSERMRRWWTRRRCGAPGQDIENHGGKIPIAAVTELRLVGGFTPAYWPLRMAMTAGSRSR
ncbi:MAG: WYL domain-containing protein [Holophagaceae bacterium]|uniref:WYL domain-containing protein n=1 Tax=Candidatus Geothrix skivensis TaxID=2954439 RepID=A0A9D7XHW0_9BACT|nr:WYL domain-containing protein [Candidatus Geothrix skivensis]